MNKYIVEFECCDEMKNGTLKSSEYYNKLFVGGIKVTIDNNEYYYYINIKGYNRIITKDGKIYSNLTDLKNDNIKEEDYEWDVNNYYETSFSINGIEKLNKSNDEGYTTIHSIHSRNEKDFYSELLHKMIYEIEFYTDIKFNQEDFETFEEYTERKINELDELNIDLDVI